MKKVFIFVLSATLFLQGCSANGSDQEFVEWGEYSTSQEERLKKNRIEFRVEDEKIYIKEKDIDKVVACCS